MIVGAYEQFWKTKGSCGWLWVVVGGCGGLWVVVDGCGWFWMVVGGCILQYNPIFDISLDFFS